MVSIFQGIRQQQAIRQQQQAVRQQQVFRNAMVSRFGANSSLNPRAVRTQPAGAVVAPRPPSVALFRGRLVYYA